MDGSIENTEQCRGANPVRRRWVVAAILVVVCGLSNAAHATGAGQAMPWESMMDNMLRFFTGPFAQVAGVIAIILLGIGLAFTEGGSGMRRLVTVFFGLAIAFSAATWGLDFFGYDGGAVIGGVDVAGDAPGVSEGR